MNLWHQFLWVIFPYLALVTFVLGHIYRYVNDQYGWIPVLQPDTRETALDVGRALSRFGSRGWISWSAWRSRCSPLASVRDADFLLSGLAGGTAAGQRDDVQVPLDLSGAAGWELSEEQINRLSEASAIEEVYLHRSIQGMQWA